MSKLAAYLKTFAEQGVTRSRKNPRIPKLFIIRQPTPVDPIEEKLLKQWWTDYRLQYDAVMDLFAYELRTKEVELAATIQSDFEGERERRSTLNQLWNQETRTQSINHLQALLGTLVESQDKRLLEFKQAVVDDSSKEMNRLEAVAALAPNMITRDNIDQKVDEILNADVVDYNFLIDFKGHIVRGSQPIQGSVREALSEKTESNVTDVETPPTDVNSVEV
ncbi:small subunit ribosomal protein S26 [Paragonimus westermani]|uniref:Small ribosomal subunit protein mS26 n=1 Tax=Paragonimus westermani TaxID=34504 RepID=A0A5J4NAZ6_9TREM|nr:small subunit ribosomal protein S26 [Paragonimus westermani]